MDDPHQNFKANIMPALLTDMEKILDGLDESKKAVLVETFLEKHFSHYKTAMDMCRNDRLVQDTLLDRLTKQASHDRNVILASKIGPSDSASHHWMGAFQGNLPMW